ncbi:MAG: hypothetical protein WDA59_01685 [Methanofastidiosum sp.]|jgi:hypothetical protein
MYTQVNLLAITPTGAEGSEHVAWIPKEFAKFGKYVVIHNQKYRVIEVYGSMKEPIYPEALIREHRKNTGDALPRKTNV